MYKLESGSLKEHQVTLLWNQLNECNSIPRSIERLGGLNHNKSLIYRLNGIGENGSAVIAKCSHQNRIYHEQLIYEKILPQIPVSKLQFYGVIKQKKEDDWLWMFIEEAKGIQLNRKCNEHRVLASQWLANMHLNSWKMEISDDLPKIELNTYFIYLNDSLKHIFKNISRDELKSNDIELLQRIMDLYDVIKMHWDEIEEICKASRPCLVHGDFNHNNVRICDSYKRYNLFVFDWENSGWGIMAEDLCSVDIDVYWSIIKDTRFIRSHECLQQLSYIGQILRSIAGIFWVSEHLNYEWINKTIKKLPYYENELSNMLKIMRWY